MSTDFTGDKHKDIGIILEPQNSLKYAKEVMRMAVSDPELLNAVYKEISEKLGMDTAMEIYHNCYIYPICAHCAGANYLTEGTFKKRNRSRCRIQKLITLYAADLQAKRLIKHPEKYSDAEKYGRINAISKIRELYLPEFTEYMI